MIQDHLIKNLVLIEMVYKNKNTGYVGILRLKQRGWGGKGAFETSGEIKDSRVV